MNRPSPRPGPGLQLALWLAAAAGALLLGMTAVGTIGSDLGGGGETEPLAATEIEARLARHAAAPGPTPQPAPPPPPAPPSARPDPAPVVVPAGPAGTVLARCDGDTPEVVSVNPAQGFERDDDDVPGPGTVGLDGDDVDVVVTLSCANGVPTGQVRTIAED
ncbi:hypothetical protein [Pseudonocardia sp. HH130630-07]|uniref:hypothetical protein n=1 Tax=Pseudonocardia sp. HH130630-07 TaxID=1690815 RepID=UPI000814D1A3|nr:hypothetical protein [Pseudonocardia sp. HH130630-07]ANY07215.1 hypothetical protein AFB00_14015 [Pseudonocardia sp. HH130630-07]